MTDKHPADIDTEMFCLVGEIVTTLREMEEKYWKRREDDLTAEDRKEQEALDNAVTLVVRLWTMHEKYPELGLFQEKKDD